MKMKLLITLGLIVGLGGALLWFGLKNGGKETVHPVRSTVVQAVYATGEVEPVHWAKIATQIPGKIEQVMVDEGAVVTQNQPLAKLDDSVECAKASEYLARLGFLEKEKKRYESLAARDVASKRKYDSIVSEYDAMQAQLESQNEQVGRMMMRSPMDGVVLQRDVEPGETVTLTDTLFWVGAPSPLRITAEVDEEDIALVAVGQAVQIKADAFPDAVIDGEVAEITPKGDPVDKDFRVRIRLPEETPLMIGMTVEVNIIVQTIKDALVVPLSSVVDDTVWVKAGRKFRPRTVKTGIANEQQVQVLDGIGESDTILRNALEMETP